MPTGLLRDVRVGPFAQKAGFQPHSKTPRISISISIRTSAEVHEKTPRLAGGEYTSSCFVGPPKSALARIPRASGPAGLCAHRAKLLPLQERAVPAHAHRRRLVACTAHYRQRRNNRGFRRGRLATAANQTLVHPKANLVFRARPNEASLESPVWRGGQESGNYNRWVSPRPPETTGITSRSPVWREGKRGKENGGVRGPRLPKTAMMTSRLPVSRGSKSGK